MSTDFARLLDAIGHEAQDRVSVCYREPGGTFTATLGTATDASARVRPWAGRADVWFGVCPLRPGADISATGRGSAASIARVPALWADLDAKPAPAGLGSREGCQRVVDALSAVLRAQPVAVVASGTGGLHPYWRLDRYPASEHDRAVALLRRWGVLVRAIAVSEGGGADNVFDPSRVLRVPGTRNMKPDGGAVTATFAADDADVELDTLTLDQLAEALDLAGIRDEPVRDTSTPAVPLAQWADSDATCNYVVGMVRGWATDHPTTGRHQWLMGQAVRLAAARRMGCLAAAHTPAAQEALRTAFGRILASTTPVRAEAPYEVAGALQWAVSRVEGMSEDGVRGELGGHRHPDKVPPHIDPDTGEILDEPPLDDYGPEEPPPDDYEPRDDYSPEDAPREPIDADAVLTAELEAVLALRGPDRWARYEQARRTLAGLVERGLLDPDRVAEELASLGDIARDVIIPLKVGSDRAFPVHVLPAGMAAAVREVADAVQVDPAVPATAFLGAAAGAVGARTRVHITDTWSRWCNLYVTVVAESGDGKSPGMAPALSPLAALGDRLREEADEAKRRAKVLLPVLKQELQAVQRGAAVVGDMMVLQEQIDEAEAALSRDARAVVDDVTPERLAQLMADNGDVLTAWNDEGALIQHMLGMYAANPSVGLFLKGWDATPHTQDRKGGNGTPGAAINLKEPRLVVVAAVQPSVIAHMGDPRHRDLVERGVVGRLLISWPGSTAGTRMLSGRTAAPYTAAPAWNAHLAGMLTTDATDVTFNPEAQRTFLAWHDRVEAGLPLGRAYADTKPFAVKIRDAVARLAGLFARLEGCRIVTAEHVERGIALGEYYLTHAEAVVEAWSGSPVGAARKLLAKLQARPAATRCKACPDGDGYVIHVRDAARWTRTPTDVAIGALEVLEQHGYVRPADPDERFGEAGRGFGKTSPHVVVNPALLAQGATL